METDNSLLAIRKTLQNRELTVSASAWERLELQLEDHEATTRKRNWRIVGYAATLACFIATVSYLLTVPKVAPNKIILPAYETAPIIVVTTPDMGIPLTPATSEIQFVTLQKTPVTNPVQTPEAESKNTMVITNVSESEATLPVNEPVAFTEKQATKPLYINKSKLLASVTSTTSDTTTKKPEQEIITPTIVDGPQMVTPDVLLSEVEEEINDDTFKKTFVKRLSGSINTIATAFTERNKSE